MAESTEVPTRLEQLRGDRMRTPDEVAAMLRLKGLGWGERRIAAEGWVGYRRPRRPKALDELDDWLAEVPWRLIGETVQVAVAGSRVSIHHRGVEIAAHT